MLGEQKQAGINFVAAEDGGIRLFFLVPALLLDFAADLVARLTGRARNELYRRTL